jgi:hypothetical protein
MVRVADPYVAPPDDSTRRLSVFCAAYQSVALPKDRLRRLLAIRAV